MFIILNLKGNLPKFTISSDKFNTFDVGYYLIINYIVSYIKVVKILPLFIITNMLILKESKELKIFMNYFNIGTDYLLNTFCDFSTPEENKITRKGYKIVNMGIDI